MDYSSRMFTVIFKKVCAFSRLKLDFPSRLVGAERGAYKTSMHIMYTSRP